MSSQNPPPLSQRPTTPHRRSLTYSIAQAHTPTPHFPISGASTSTPLETILLRPQVKKMHSNDIIESKQSSALAPLTELVDALADLDQNLQHIQTVHDSVNSFTESFSSLIYGLEVNAWCFEFKEAPTKLHMKRYQNIPPPANSHSNNNTNNARPTTIPDNRNNDFDPNSTYMTDENSFVETPVYSKSRAPSRQSKAQSRPGTTVHTRVQPPRVAKLIIGTRTANSDTTRRPGGQPIRGGLTTPASSDPSTARGGSTSRASRMSQGGQQNRVTKPVRGRPSSTWK